MRQIDTCQGKLWVWNQDQVGAVLSGGAFWDWQLRPLIDEAAARYPERTAIDVGASVGWFTLYMAGKFKAVIAVEAHPATAQMLILNLMEHGITNVLAQSYVASDTVQRFSLASPEHLGWPVPADLNDTPNPSSIAFLPDPQGLYHGGPVDALVLPHELVGCIKVDAQGGDLVALRGLERTIERSRPYIVVEYEGGPAGWFGDTLQDYLNFFDRHGYVWEELPASNYALRPKELVGG